MNNQFYVVQESLRRKSLLQESLDMAMIEKGLNILYAKKEELQKELAKSGLSPEEINSIKQQLQDINTKIEQGKQLLSNLKPVINTVTNTIDKAKAIKKTIIANQNLIIAGFIAGGAIFSLLVYLLYRKLKSKNPEQANTKIKSIVNSAANKAKSKMKTKKQKDKIEKRKQSVLKRFS